MNTRLFYHSIFFSIVCIVLSVFFACGGGNEKPEAEFSIAVFVPGVVSGSPTYEMLVAGVERAVAERKKASVKVVEGGFNQGEWADGVTSLAATGSYDLIVTSNPALPRICQRVASQFPEQKFLVLDGHLEGNPNIYTFLYNQMEQAYMIGHMGGLITTSSLPGATADLSVGLIAGQEYPIMNSVIRVGYEMGLSSVDQNISLDFRIVGNWYDAAKGAELAASMFDSGVDVILAIAGGANQGVLSEAKKRGRYVLWYDSNGYALAPGTVLGSSALKQDLAAYEKTLLAIDGKLSYGTAEIRGVREGYVEFVQDDDLYLKHVPESLRKRQKLAVDELKSGRTSFVMPVF